MLITIITLDHYLHEYIQDKSVENKTGSERLFMIEAYFLNLFVSIWNYFCLSQPVFVYISKCFVINNNMFYYLKLFASYLLV